MCFLDNFCEFLAAVSEKMYFIYCMFTIMACGCVDSKNSNHIYQTEYFLNRLKLMVHEMRWILRCLMYVWFNSSTLYIYPSAFISPYFRHVKVTLR